VRPLPCFALRFIISASASDFCVFRLSSGSADETKGMPLPKMLELVNFPQYFGIKPSLEGERGCTMCGQTCVVVRTLQEITGEVPAIPVQNGNVCSLCNKIVWVVVESGIQVKFCYKCRRFRQSAEFQNSKGETAAKCARCLGKQRVYSARYNSNKK